MSVKAERGTSLVELSKGALAVLAAISAIVGGVSGFLGFYAYAYKELDAWHQIKSVHADWLETEKTTVYNHKGLGKEGIAAIKKDLQLPNFDLFALKSELPNMSGVVRYGDRLIIQSEYRDFTLQSRLDGQGAVASSDRPEWDQADEWLLRKSE